TPKTIRLGDKAIGVRGQRTEDRSQKIVASNSGQCWLYVSRGDKVRSTLLTSDLCPLSLLLPIVRLHAPVELVAQGAVVTVPGDFDQLESDRGAAHRDAMAPRQGDRQLSVED